MSLLRMPPFARTVPFLDEQKANSSRTGNFGKGIKGDPRPLTPPPNDHHTYGKAPKPPPTPPPDDRLTRCKAPKPPPTPPNDPPTPPAKSRAVCYAFGKSPFSPVVPHSQR